MSNMAEKWPLHKKAGRKDRPFLWLAVESKVASVVGAGLIDNRGCFFNLLDNFGGIAGVGYIPVKAFLQQGGRLGIA